MQKILFTLAIFSVFFIESSRSLTRSNQQLCVQTLNTYGMFYADNLEERHQKTLEFLKQHDCDIILLQEVWEEAHYQNLAQLSQDINMNSVYFRKPYDDKKSGLVGLFRGDVQESDVFYFPSPIESGLEFLYDLFRVIDKGFGMAQVRTSLSHQNPFLVFNFHLDNISQTQRISQLLLYLEWILENSYLNQAIIAGGDFNFEPSSLEFRIMKKLFQFKNPYEQMRKPHECTHLCADGGYDFFNSFIGEGIRDYIFFKSSSKTNFDPQDVFIFPKRYNDVFLSDHFGLRAIFNLDDHSQNPLEDLISENILRERMKEFEQGLFEIETFLENRNDTVPEMSFIQSLHKDLKNPQSNVVQYLQY